MKYLSIHLFGMVILKTSHSPPCILFKFTIYTCFFVTYKLLYLGTHTFDRQIPETCQQMLRTDKTQYQPRIMKQWQGGRALRFHRCVLNI